MYIVMYALYVCVYAKENDIIFGELTYHVKIYLGTFIYNCQDIMYNNDRTSACNNFIMYRRLGDFYNI